MAEFVGKNDTESAAEIESRFFPTLSVADFQSQFQYLKDTDEQVVSSALLNAVIEVEYSMLTLTGKFDSFAEFQKNHPLDPQAVFILYQRAVFNFAMAHVLSCEITTNDTKNASDRAENLSSRVETHNASARQAISMLSSDNTMHVEVV